MSYHILFSSLWGPVQRLEPELGPTFPDTRGGAGSFARAQFLFPRTTFLAVADEYGTTDIIVDQEKPDTAKKSGDAP